MDLSTSASDLAAQIFARLRQKPIFPKPLRERRDEHASHSEMPQREDSGGSLWSTFSHTVNVIPNVSSDFRQVLSELLPLVAPRDFDMVREMLQTNLDIESLAFANAFACRDERALLSSVLSIISANDDSSFAGAHCDAYELQINMKEDSRVRIHNDVIRPFEVVNSALRTRNVVRRGEINLIVEAENAVLIGSNDRFFALMRRLPGSRMSILFRGEKHHETTVTCSERGSFSLCMWENAMCLVQLARHSLRMRTLNVSEFLEHSSLVVTGEMSVLQRRCRPTRVLQFSGAHLTLSRFSLKQRCSPFTIEMWIFPQGVEEHQVLFAHGDKSIEEIVLELIPIECGVRIRGGTRSPHFGSVFVHHDFCGKSLIGHWSHIGLAFTGSSWRLVVDGEEKAVLRVCGPSVGVLESPCTLGRHFLGLIFEFRVWSVFRDETEIRRDMLSAVESSQLVARYPLSNEESWILLDHSQNRNHHLLSAGWAFAEVHTLPITSHRLFEDITAAFLFKSFEIQVCMSQSKFAALFHLDSRAVVLEFDLRTRCRVRSIVGPANRFERISLEKDGLLHAYFIEGSSAVEWSVEDNVCDWYAAPSHSIKSAAELSISMLRKQCDSTRVDASVVPLPEIIMALQIACYGMYTSRVTLVENLAVIIASYFSCARCNPNVFTEIFGEPYADCQQLLQSANRALDLNSSSLRDVLEHLSLSQGCELLSSAISVLLTEKGITQVLARYSGRLRAVVEERLFLAAAQYFSVNAEGFRQKPEKLLPTATSLLSEGYFQAVQSLQSDCLRRPSITPFAKSIQRAMFRHACDGSSFQTLTVYINSLLKSCEKLFLLFANMTRRGSISPQKASDVLNLALTHDLLAECMPELHLLPSSTALLLVTNLCSCRDAMNTLGSVIGKDSWFVRLCGVVVVETARLAGSLAICDDEGTEESVSMSPFFPLFRGGFRKNGTARDAFVRNLIQGVGSVSRQLTEIQHEDFPLRSSDTAWLSVERTLVACFGNLLLDDASVATPNREVLQQLYKFVKNLRPWLMSKRQLDPQAIDAVGSRAVFLSKLDPGVGFLISQGSTQMQPSSNPNKKWRRMFQAWKQMRNVKVLMSMLLHRAKSNEEMDTSVLITTFLQSTEPNCADIERLLQARTLRAQTRMTGFNILKGLIEEGRLHHQIDEQLRPVVCSVFCGWHYLNHISGCNSETLVRLRGAFFQLQDEILRRVESGDNALQVTEMFLAVVAAPWAETDYSRLSLKIVSHLGHCCSKDCESDSFGMSPVFHHIPSERLVSPRPEHCGGSVASGCETCTIRGHGNRGAFLSPIEWSLCETVAFQYYEVTLIDILANATVSVGLGPRDFVATRPLGWDVSTFAIHSDDGVLFAESSSGCQTGTSFQVGDTIGCGWKPDGDIFWTKNGKILAATARCSCERLTPIVGVDGKAIVGLNFGRDPFLLSPLPLAATRKDDALKLLPFDVLKCFSFRCVAVLEAHSKGGEEARQALRFAGSIMSELERLLALDRASDSFLQRICELIHVLCDKLRRCASFREWLKDHPRDSVCQELCRVIEKSRSSRVRCAAIDALGSSMLLFLGCTESDIAAKTVNFLVDLACDSRHMKNSTVSDWTDECAWYALHWLRELNSVPNVLGDEVCQVISECLQSSDRRRLCAALVVMGGSEMPPKIGQTVRVRGRDHIYDEVQLMSWCVVDEVCTVVTPGDSSSRRPIMVSIANVDVPPSQWTFPDRSNENHAREIETVLKISSKHGSQEGFINETSQCSVYLLRVLQRCLVGGHFQSEKALRLVLDISLPLCNGWKPNEALSALPSGVLELEEIIGSALLLGRDSSPELLVGSPVQCGSVPSAEMESPLTAPDSIDEVRTRMAQELSMRGFSLEMCLIALEETHYDRSAALRLLTDHHEDLLEVLRNEDEEDEDGSDDDGATSDDDERNRSRDEDDDDDGDDEQDDDGTSESSPESDEESHSSHLAMNEGLRFDGSSHLRLTSDAACVGPQFTLDFWIRPQNVEEPQIIFLQRAVSDTSLVILIEDHKLKFGWGRLDQFLDASSSQSDAVCVMQLSDERDPNRWTRITCVQDCSDLSLYKNGLLKENAVAPSAESLLANELFVGGIPDGTFGFSGDLKDLRIFENALPHEVVESMFSLSLAPTASASSSQLVVHLRFDDGKFPLQNAAASPNAITVTTSAHGELVWLHSDLVTDEKTSVAVQQEIDFTTLNDSQQSDDNVLDLSQGVTSFLSICKRLRAASTTDLQQSHDGICKELTGHYACRLSLQALGMLSSPPPEWLPSYTKAIVYFVIRSGSEADCKNLVDLLVTRSSMDSFAQLLENVIGQLLVNLERPQRTLSFESAHPCKGLSENPTEVSAVNQFQYSIFFDQRCSANSMLFSVYTDPSVGTVVAQYTSGMLSSFRVQGSKFYFDVRLDNVSTQWGYKVYVVCDAEPQWNAAKILRKVMLHHLQGNHTRLPSALTSPIGLTTLALGALVSSGRCRRLILVMLTDILRFEPVSLDDLEVLRLHEIRKMAEKQFRREIGMDTHSKFVQVCTEYFKTLKDVERQRGEIVELDRTLNEQERFAQVRLQRKRVYASRFREGKDHVGVERLRFPDNLRIESNIDKTIAVWSERAGGSVVADVPIHSGRWYFEVKMVATGDVSIGVASGVHALRKRDRDHSALMDCCYNGRHGTCVVDSSSSLSENEGGLIAGSARVRWKNKDTVGVVIDCNRGIIELRVNGASLCTVLSYNERMSTIGSEDGAASAVRNLVPTRADTRDGFNVFDIVDDDPALTVGISNQDSDGDDLRYVGVLPYLVFGADEGVVVNFGGTHFEFDVPGGALPLDPSQLALGTLIPFNQLRALEDVTESISARDLDSLPPFFVEEADPFESPSHRRGPPNVSLTSHDPKISINLLEVKHDGVAFSTVRGDCIVFKGRWYYEVTLQTQGVMQVGWLSTYDGADATVGDTPWSWAIDGFRRQRWNNRTALGVGVARRWIAGDVVGCSIDMDHGRVIFYLNGRHVIDGHFPIKTLPQGIGFLPAATLRSGNAVVFNFGSSQFRFKPEGFSALGVPDTWDERIDTYYATLSDGARDKRREALVSAYYVLSAYHYHQSDGSHHVRHLSPVGEVVSALVEAVDVHCKVANRTFHQLTHESLTDIASSNLPLKDAIQRFIKKPTSLDESTVVWRAFEVTKGFARIACAALPLLHVHHTERVWGDVLVRTARRLLFASVREQMVQSMLHETNCKTDSFRLSINRHKARSQSETKKRVEDTVFGQTFELLGHQNARLFRTSKRMWSVVFIGEGAEDVGGPYREHLGEMCRELMSNVLTLFVPTPNHTGNVGTHRDAFTPNPSATSLQELHMYAFVGRLMGAAIRSGEPLNLTFPPVFWKLLLDEYVDVSSLADVDQVCAQCVRELREMKTKFGEEGRDLFNETFETEVFTTHTSEGRLRELVEGGVSKSLTYDNCDEYVRLLVKTRLYESMTQIRKIREGLISVVPETALSLLTPVELELRVCGMADYSVNVLKESTTYEGITSDDRRIAFLWEALETSTAMQRRLFLKFVSGRERMPVQLRVLPMVASQCDPNQLLPRAATCFFALELPDYSSAEILREKLMYAIENCQDIDTDFRARDAEDDDGPQLVVGVGPRSDDAGDVTGDQDG